MAAAAAICLQSKLWAADRAAPGAGSAARGRVRDPPRSASEACSLPRARTTRAKLDETRELGLQGGIRGDAPLDVEHGRRIELVVEIGVEQ